MKRVGAIVGLTGLVLIASTDSAAADVPTFTRDIAPIVFRHCVSCHHPGQNAPFSLLTYEDVAARATDRARHQEPLHAAVEARAGICRRISRKTRLDRGSDRDDRAMVRQWCVRRRLSGPAAPPRLERRMEARHARSRDPDAGAVRGPRGRTGRVPHLRGAGSDRVAASQGN